MRVGERGAVFGRDYEFAQLDTANPGHPQAEFPQKIVQVIVFMLDGVVIW